MYARTNFEWNVTLEDFASWRFEPEGSYSADCSRGRGLARTFLSRRQEPGFQPALGWAMSAIAKLDRPFSGIEIGFFAVISGALQVADLSQPLPKLVVIDGGAS
jgi:hypothetical protein